MNQKKAKGIRRLVKQLIERKWNGVVDEPTSYSTTKHAPKLVNTGKLDDNGKPIFAQYDTSTHIVKPTCPRGVYRRMKKHSPMAVLYGRA